MVNATDKLPILSVTLVHNGGTDWVHFLTGLQHDNTAFCETEACTGSKWRFRKGGAEQEVAFAFDGNLLDWVTVKAGYSFSQLSYHPSGELRIVDVSGDQIYWLFCQVTCPGF